MEGSKGHQEEWHSGIIMPTVLDAAAHEENTDLALRDAPCDWRLTDAADFLSAEEDSACSARQHLELLVSVNAEEEADLYCSTLMHLVDSDENVLGSCDDEKHDNDLEGSENSSILLSPSVSLTTEDQQQPPLAESSEVAGNTHFHDGVSRSRRERVAPKRDDFICRVADKKSFINHTKKAGKVDAINARSRTSPHIVVRASGQTSTNTAIKATPWRCLECNIFFDCPQALGGHKTNSRDHKRRVEAMEQGDSSSLPTVPRLSSQVYSFEENMQNQDEGSTFKRAKKPPMAQLDCFEELVCGFPDEIVRNVNERKSPAAFFASCNLEVFKRHMDFGKLAERAIAEHFNGPCHVLEAFLEDRDKIWQLVSQNKGPARSESKQKELDIFARMLVTKKRFLDINRRAVSKRLKNMRERETAGKKLKQALSRRVRSKK